MDLLTDPQICIAFLTLLALEIVLGIDTIIFIAIPAGKLPEHQRARARNLGLSLALIMRILLLFSLSWVIGLTGTVFSLFGQDFSGRGLILIAGGAFLLVKATLEIHERLEGEEARASTGATATFAGVIVPIIVLDAVFALAFLVLIGATLVGEGFDVKTPKGLIYGAIAFAILVEGLNLRYKAIQARRQHHHTEAVHLRPVLMKETAEQGKA